MSGDNFAIKMSIFVCSVYSGNHNYMHMVFNNDTKLRILPYVCLFRDEKENRIAKPLNNL